VGKSSLLNALAGAEVAIVTAIAGTTRDKVSQQIQVEGVPLNIVDTAGLRTAGDEVERIGIERTWAAVAEADVVLLLQTSAGRDADEKKMADAGAKLASHESADQAAMIATTASISSQLARRLPARVPLVYVFNKIDLIAGQLPGAIENRALWLSAKTGSGIESLRAALLAIGGWQAGAESSFIARERHLIALRAAAAHLTAAAAHAGHGASQLELFAEELRLAQQRLNSITGQFTADDLLGVIFSRFCIGK
jgi:tRNA modification GTPase